MNDKLTYQAIERTLKAYFDTLIADQVLKPSDFSEHDLRYLTTCVHHAVIEAEIMQGERRHEANLLTRDYDTD